MSCRLGEDELTDEWSSLRSASFGREGPSGSRRSLILKRFVNR